MKQIKAVPITEENFSLYGYIANISDPDSKFALGCPPANFHRDMLLAPMASTAPIAFGSLKIDKRPQIIEDVEYHSMAVEIMMPMDDDVILYAGPANCGEPDPDKLEAFIVPAGTMIGFRAGAWHGAPYPVNKERSTVLICLPERTYLNDTKKFFLEKDQFIEII